MRKLSAPVALGLMAALIGMFPLACGGADAIKFGGGVTGTGGNDAGGVPGSGAGGATGAGGSISTGGVAPGSAGRVGAVGGEGDGAGPGGSGGTVGAGGGGGRETGGLSGGAGHGGGMGGVSMSTGGVSGHGGTPPTGGVVGSGGGTATGGVVGTGGAAASGGSSGSGGVAGQSGSTCGTKLPTTCADLDSAYTSELKAQLVCGGLLGKMECMKLVSSTIGCTCVKGFVVEDNCLMALQKRYADQGCPSTCARTAPPPTCTTPTSAKCMAQGLSLQSMCVSM